MGKIRHLDCFAGIGGFALALQQSVGKDNCEQIGYSEIDKFAKKVYERHFPECKYLGNITKIDIDNLEDFDLLTGGFPCFKEGTMILTKDGYKDIKDIRVGDYVLTHTNKYQKVLKHFITPNKKGIYKLKIQGSLDTFATNKHPYYVREMSKKWNNKIRRYERSFSKPKWKNVEDLTKGDFIGFNKQLSITENTKELKFYKLVGRLLADGWWGKYSRGPNVNHTSNRVILCCNKNECKEIEDLLDGLYNYSKVEERTVFKYHITNTELVEYMEQFGKYSYGKFIPTNIMGLKKEYLEQLLLGYIDGDGHYYKDKGYCRVSSVSKKLILGIQQLVHKVYGTPTSIYHTKRKSTTIIEGRKVNQKDTFELDIKFEKKKQDNGKKIDGYIWMPFKSKEYLDEVNTVYNIEVENDNSYTVNNCIVHNCQDVSVAGKQNLEGGRTILVEYLLQILEKKQPRYFVFENVKGLMSKKFTKLRKSIFERIENAGYNYTYKVLNTKNFGLPQNRERVFIVGILGNNKFKYPEGKTNGKIITHIQNKQVAKRKYNVDIEGLKSLLRENKKPVKEIAKYLGIKKTTVEHYFRKDNYFAVPDKDIWFKLKEFLGIKTDKFDKSIMEFEILDGVYEKGNRIYNINGIAPTLTTSGEISIVDFEFPQGKKLNIFLKDILEEKVDEKYYITEQQYKNLSFESLKRLYNKIAPTLTAGDGGYRLKMYNFDNITIRKLTPTEYGRLQGFPDGWNNNMSDRQRYKQFGNAVSVPVVVAIFNSLFKNSEE